MANPILPEDIEGKWKNNLPDEVIHVFNELIVENWKPRKSATVTYLEAANRIASRLDIPVSLVYDKSYLEIEEVFREAGWDVEVDTPAINEAYEGYFVFSKPRVHKS